MITPIGYNTDLSNAIRQVLLTTSGSVVYIDGEYFYAIEFYPAEGSKEYTTLTGFSITSNLTEYVPMQDTSGLKMPVTHGFIEKSVSVKQQFHKSQPYRWFQNTKKR
jgi:hypothetical protein